MSERASGASVHTLAAEIIRAERDMETYGGDAPYDPRKSGKSDDTHTGPDPYLVTWESENDLSNPQNWSKTYKWILTGVCCLMTVNV